MAHSGKTITFATDLLPHENNIYSLGATNQRWKIYGDVDGNAKGLLYANSSVTAAPGDGKLTYSYLVPKSTSGLFNATDNSNAILNISRHSGNYVSQLGFSSDGRIYYRKFSGAALDTTTTWKKIAWTSDIEALDVSNITGFGAGKTLATLTETDGKIAATFQDISITKSQISDFPSTMTPASHSHGNIGNGGTIATSTSSTIATNDAFVISTTANSGKLTRSSIVFDTSKTTKVLSQAGTWIDMYTHPTGAGNNHIPSGGSSGQFLGWDSAGVAKWVANPNTDTKMNVSLAGAAITHNYILMTSTTPTSTTAQHTGLGANSLWVNSVDKGKFELVLGNSTSTGTSGGQFGQLALYSESTAGTYLKSASGSSWKTATLPAATGILAMIENSTAKGSDTKPVKVAATGLITECSTYAGGTALTLNNVSKSASTASIYAATANGTAGQVLKANGGTDAPTWENEYSVEIIRMC